MAKRILVELIFGIGQEYFVLKGVQVSQDET